MTSRARLWLVDRGGLLALLVLAVYAFVASPYIVGNDNAEFATLGTVGGIAHPSGYPGNILWLRALSWLPGDSAAHTTALATVVMSVLQVLVLHAACRAWGASPLAATVATALYAGSPVVLRYATEAEAFAGNQLAVSLVLWLAAARGPLRGNRRAFALGLVAGLGMTNHMTCTLAAPVGLLGVVRAMRERQDRRGLAVAVAGAGWLVGMLPYLYLFVAPQNLLSWPTTAGELADIVLRRAYGGAFGFSGTGDPVPYVDHLGELAKTLARGWLWLLLPVGVGVLGWRIARPAGDEPRPGWIALGASFVIAGPMLALKYDVPVAEFGLHIVHRFHLLPLLLLAIPVAVGISEAAARVTARRTEPLRPGLVAIAAHLAFALAIALSLPQVGRYRSPAMEYMARNTLASLPPNAVVMAPAVDELDVGIRYLQLTAGMRPDVLFFRWRDASVAWYRDKLIAAGLPVAAGETYTGGLVIDRLHAAGRPVFAYWWDAELVKTYPTYPYGVLVRVLPRDAKPPPLAEVVATNREMFEKFELGYAFPGPADEFATWVHRKYAGTWARLAEQLNAAGMHEQAAEAVALARALGPQR